MSDKEKEFTKVDRALEMRVIDWLQWSEFPEDISKRLDDLDMAQLTLKLLSKRKAALDQANEKIRDLSHELKMAMPKVKRLEEKIQELEENYNDEVDASHARGLKNVELLKENKELRKGMAALVDALEKIRGINAEMGCECGADDWPNEPIYMCDTHRSLDVIGKALKNHRSKYEEKEKL